MSDFGNYRWPKAAKEHRCEWCGEPIPKGEFHFQFTGIWEGDWQNWRMHQECENQSARECREEGFSPYENERPVTVRLADGEVLTAATIRECAKQLKGLDAWMNLGKYQK